jgi:hypothetical protein
MRDAVSWLCNDVFDHCKMMFAVTSNFVSATDWHISQHGTIAFARCNKTLFVDKCLSETQRRPDGSTTETGDESENFVADGQQDVFASTIPVGSTKQITHVSCHPSMEYRLASQHVLNSAGRPLMVLLGSDPPFCRTLGDLVRDMPWRCERGPDGSLVASSSNNFGSIEVSCIRVNGAFRPKAIVMTQLRDNDYYLNGGVGPTRKLRELTNHQGMEDLEMGVDSISTTLSIDYPTIPANDRPFTLMTYQNVSRAGKLTETGVVRIELKQYLSPISDADIARLRTPIPDGTVVLTSDSSLQNLELAWHANKVVRRIDGVAIDAVQTSVESSQGTFWRPGLRIFAGCCVLSLVVVGLFRRRNRRHIGMKAL